MGHVPSEPHVDASEQSSPELDNTVVDRRSFMRGAAFIGAAIVGATALPPSAEAAKRCYPTPPKKPSLVPLTIESETGVTLQGNINLDTVKVSEVGTTIKFTQVSLLIEGDSFRRVSIVPMMDSLASLTLVDADLHRPPRVLFSWGTGKIKSFHGVVESVSVAYTAFLADGTPVGGSAATDIQVLEDCAVV